MRAWDWLGTSAMRPPAMHPLQCHTPRYQNSPQCAAMVVAPAIPLVRDGWCTQSAALPCGRSVRPASGSFAQALAEAEGCEAAEEEEEGLGRRMAFVCFRQPLISFCFSLACAG